MLFRIILMLCSHTQTSGLGPPGPSMAPSTIQQAPYPHHLYVACTGLCLAPVAELHLPCTLGFAGCLVPPHSLLLPRVTHTGVWCFILLGLLVSLSNAQTCTCPRVLKETPHGQAIEMVRSGQQPDFDLWACSSLEGALA